MLTGFWFLYFVFEITTNFRKILEKYLWRSSFYSKVTGISPAAVLKLNSFTSIFQGFCGNYDLSFFFCLLFRSTYFKEHLLLSGCFWKYCFKHINGKENKKDSCVFHKHVIKNRKNRKFLLENLVTTAKLKNMKSQKY